VRRALVVVLAVAAAAVAATPALAAPAVALRATAVAAGPLPILTLRTAGPIRDDPKVAGLLHVRRGTRTLYAGRVGVELRGHSSRTYPKKQYGLETWGAAGRDKAVSLLGLPKESDWVLSASYADKTLMRNTVAYSAARALGRYASRTVFVELVLNGRYHGVYVLAERPKLDKRRIRAAADDVTGGYLLELTLRQKVRPRDIWFRTPVTRRVVILVGAGGKKLTNQRRAWITEHMRAFERTLYGPEFRHPERGWRRFLDEAAAVDYILLQELFKNQDAFLSSTFAHKGSGDKLAFGPVWDFDIALGNSNFGRSAHLGGWLLTPRAARPWASRLYDDPGFLAALEARWRGLRRAGLVGRLLGQIERDAARLHAAQARNFERWPILGRYIWPNPVDPATRHVRRTYRAEVTYLKSWLQRRAAWIDANIATIGREWGTRR